MVRHFYCQRCYLERIIGNPYKIPPEFPAFKGAFAPIMAALLKQIRNYERDLAVKVAELKIKSLTKPNKFMANYLTSWMN